MKTLADEWDDFWRHRSSQPNANYYLRCGLHSHLVDSVLPLLRMRGARRLLIPGNGCWWGPHAFVYLGFDVTVVDISPVANASLGAGSLTLEQMGDFLPEYRERRDKGNKSHTILERDKNATRQRVVREAVAGGKLTIVTADINEYEPEQGFDAILDDRLMQVLPAHQWAGVARRYAEWVGDGFCFIHTLNVTEREEFEAAFQRAGFRDHQGTHDAFPREGRTVLFWYGSG